MIILSPELSGLILAAIQSILLGNNGYADIGNNPEVANGVRAAGFIVIASKDLFGMPVNRGFTKESQAALAAAAAAGEDYAVSLYKPVKAKIEGPDYEAMILSRDEARAYASGGY